MVDCKNCKYTDEYCASGDCPNDKEAGMTQRIFDKDNKKDMVDLWDILPDEVYEIHKGEGDSRLDNTFYFKDGYVSTILIAINWRDDTVITRPVQEATEYDIGKLCYFWEGKDFVIGVLKDIGDKESPDIYCMDDGRGGLWYIHCRRLTKQEIEELC